MLVTALVAVSIPASALAESGYDIVKKSRDKNGQGYVGERTKSVMTLFDKSGEKVVAYQLNNMTLEGNKGNSDTTKSLVRFLGPPNEKGTALLTHEKPGGDESRWLYLAETRQVKQIASSDKSASFKGSEIAYEDMAIDTLDKYDYKLLGEEKLDGKDMYKIERTPKFADSGYKRVISWFDKTDLYIVQSHFYDKADKLLKTGVYGKFKAYNGLWRGHKADVTNVQTNRKTTVINGAYKVGLKLSDRLFTPSQLQKQ